MIKRKHGDILFTASMASLFGSPLIVAYSAANSAYLGMVKTLAAAVLRHGVRVNAIAPGWIESDMLRQALVWPHGAHQQNSRTHADDPFRHGGRHRSGGDLFVFARARFITA